MKLKAFICLVGFLLGGAFLLGCGEPRCTGKSGCFCDDKTPCESGLLCQDAVCRSSSSEPQTEPPTEPTNSENPQSDAGNHDTNRCEAGTLDCRCLELERCNKGLRCENNVCRECPEGTAGCACKGGDTCGSGLKCENGVCAGCMGQANCACYKNNSCDVGLKCDIDVQGTSQCKSCKAQGEAGCNCEKDENCGASLVCVNRRCSDASALAALPKNPVCYAPCEGNVRERDGTVRQCHPTYRLLQGCLIGQTCTGGSCIETAKAQKLDSSDYPFCMKSADCPSWQACIQGRCYSNCSATADCPDGFGCHAYVCRRKCSLTKTSCVSEETCQNVGSTEDEGFCMPTASRKIGVPKRTQIDQTFVLSERELNLTNLESSSQLSISNNHDYLSTITIARESDTTGGAKPLSWLSVDLCKTYADADRTACKEFEGKPTAKEPLIVDVPGGSRVIVKILGADKAPPSATSYSGVLRVKSTEVEQSLAVRYRRSTSGRWQGKIYSFGNFDDTEIDKFPADASLDLRSLKNAFLRRWLNFKRNEITFEQFNALLLSIRTDTWRLARVQSDCRKLFSTQASEDVVCYPFSSSKGYEILSYSQREAPVPSGISTLNLAIDVKESGKLWEGRIVSQQTLHYPGDPQIKIEFEQTPGADAKSFLKSLTAVADLGGRYHVDENESCTNATDFQKVTQPWLIPGFTMGSFERGGSLFRNRYECRSQAAPKSVPAGASDKQKTEILAANLSLNAANPIPNGRVLRRQLDLIDGILFENRILFAIVRERFTSPLGNSQNSALSKDWVRYGYIWLTYTESEFKDADAQGSVASRCTSNAGCGAGSTCQNGLCQSSSQLRQVTCSPEIVRAAMNRAIAKMDDLSSWNATDLDNLVSALMGQQGSSVTDNSDMQIVRSENNGDVEYTYDRDGLKRYIHFYCEDTKQFDGGPTSNPKDCPVGSKVIFFEHTMAESTMRGHSCQASQASSFCNLTLEQFRSDSVFRENVPFRCAQKTEVLCEANRKDLRDGKIFFKPSTQASFVSSFSTFENALLEAFRYRIKFQGRAGQSLGFTPVMCNKTAPSQTPYCYDPEAIEQIEQRVNCLEAIFTSNTLSQKLPVSTRATLKQFLTDAFAYTNRAVGSSILTSPGFETLNAELKVMLGDEAFTRSLGSRYDLANSSLISFEGDILEPNGIRISGALGYEMYNLYLSVHYYQSVLDRFYAQTETFAASFQSSSTAFLTAASVTSYVRKLLLAASRKSRSWGQIAKKYHQINRSDLAQHVLERAYISAYVEQIVLTQLLYNLTQILDSKQLPQIRQDIEQIMLTYNVALFDMQETYQKVIQRLNTFGFAEGYVPLPALQRSVLAGSPLNIFNTSIATAKEKLAIAQQKEQIALQSKRDFDTDAAQFQSELVKLENSYNEQLIQLCGELKDGDRSVPAIPKYAHLYQSGKFSDPCGMIPGSYLYNTYATLERVGLDIPQLEQQRKDLYERMDNEVLRVQKVCNDRFSLADITWKYQDELRDLNFRKDTTDLIFQTVSRTLASAVQIATTRQCIPIGGTAFSTKCSGALASAGVKVAALLAQEAVTLGLNIELNNSRKEMASMQSDFAKIQVQTPCNVCPPEEPNCSTEGAVRIASQNYLAQLALELETFRFRALSAQYNARLVLSQALGLRQRVDRLIKEQEESTSRLIDVQAAQNDPNIRIYKNDAILNAERTFEEALQEIYSLTIIYEFVTQTSYTRKSDLYLVRMVSAGDLTLESYLSQLEQAYRDFEEQFGRPSSRILVLSLRDDILRIPRIDKDGKSLNLQDRIALFQAQLNDPKNYTPEGYLSFSFPIAVDPKVSLVSPVTYNHKINYIEAEIKATERGDDVGRLYLRQSGTGVVRGVDDSFSYYSFPERTAVINPYFNGHKTFEPSIYQNYRLQERPLGNTQWQLQFNQASEKSNQDISLNSINDIILYFYYKDFSKS